MAINSSLITKLKVQLKLAINRLRMTQQKDIAIAKQQRREMAHLLEQSREQSALIRTENIIRSDMITELHELLELYCELLLARSGLLEATPCDAGLEEAVKSIIYAAPRTDIKELHVARAIMIDKFGKDFGAEAIEGVGVPGRITEKLKVEPPRQELVRAYLAEIARTYGVNWPREQGPGPDGEGGRDGVTKDDQGSDGEDGGGGQKERPLEAPLVAEDELRGASPPRFVDGDGRKPPVSIAPASPSTENPSPRVRMPGESEKKTTTGASSQGKRAPSGAAAAKKDVQKVEGKIPDADELSRRFAALKR